MRYDVMTYNIIQYDVMKYNIMWYDVVMQLKYDITENDGSLSS